MKLLKFTIILGIITVMAGNVAFAQRGELDRFKNTSLEKTNEVKMFPNPTADYLKVRIDKSTLTETSFTVHNIIGSVMKVEVEQLDKNEYRLKVEDLPSGYYLLAIRDDQGYFKETYKFLKR